MIKRDLDKINSTQSISNQADLFTDKRKTTNVNILLNRVKMDKKKDFKKKAFFLSMLVVVISLTSFFAII